LGKVPGLNREERVGWEEIARLLDGRPRAPEDLFEPEPETPEWASIDLKRVRTERVREFGTAYLGLALWRRLRLDGVLRQIQPAGREDVGWDSMACVLALARFCSPGSELAIAERWYAGTALDDLLGVSAEKINDDRLYRSLDALLPHKDALCAHLQERYAQWFGTQFDFLFYDVTSTYFEGMGAGNVQAKRGYSRDQRSDCVQVCIGLVVTREGLPVAYEVFNGNRRDVTTLEDMVGCMEGKYGKAQRIWVLDRGIVSEDNLVFLRERGAKYIVGTPRGMLKTFERELCDQEWTEVEPGVEVKLVRHPEYGEERFVLCRSRGRREKERQILERQKDRLREKLEKIRVAVRAGRLFDVEQTARKIGRWMGRYTRAEILFDVQLIQKEERVTDLVITEKAELSSWAELAHGSYLLRTNLVEEDPRELWHAYMNLTQAENAFRISKSDLGLRPVYHQKAERVQAHILVCFLALVMWKCLEQWMSAQGLGTCARRLIAAFRMVHSMDVVLFTRNGKELRMRVVGRPEEHVRLLAHRLGLLFPNRPKRIENVVAKTAPALA
jgi:transposase